MKPFEALNKNKVVYAYVSPPTEPNKEPENEWLQEKRVQRGWEVHVVLDNKEFCRILQPSEEECKRFITDYLSMEPFPTGHSSYVDII